MSKLLTLRRPTTLSKLLQEAHPGHPTSRTLGNIPQWTNLEPYEKLPDRRCAVHTVILSRGDLGQPIGHFSASHGFDLQDPLLQVVQMDYNLLHDQHLRKYWTKATKQHLLQHGMIDAEGRVICTMKEFNEFRRFLYLQIRRDLHDRFYRMDTARIEEQHWIKIQDMMKTHEDYDEKLLKRNDRAKRLDFAKHSRWKDAIEKYNERTKAIALEKDYAKQQLQSEGHRRDLMNKIRCQELLALRKRKTLILRRKLHERDFSFQQRLTINKQRKAEIQSTMKQEWFRMHYLAYTRERNEAKALLEKALEEMQQKVSERKERYRQQYTKLEEDLLRRTTGNIARKYERRSRKALVQALLKECRKSICKKATDQTIESAIQAAYAIHTTMSQITSSTTIIDTASQFILDLQEEPTEPLPIDHVTMGYVVDRLRGIREDILHATVRQVLQLIEHVAVRNLKRISKPDHQSIRSSLSGRWNVSKEATISASPKCAPSRVSMGPVSIIARYETENDSFKKCRNRPPTPVTSVTSLVECTLRQPKEERTSVSSLALSADSAHELARRIYSDDYPLIHVMHSQRRYLEGNLLKYRTIVQSYVEQRVFAVVNELDQLTATAAGAAGKKSSEGDKDKLLHRTARALLKFPEDAYHYANALFDSVHELAAEAIQKVNHILEDA